jgi:hypothetical protein
MPSYKFALAKSLLEIASDQSAFVKMADLALPFSRRNSLLFFVQCDFFVCHQNSRRRERYYVAKQGFQT